MNGGALHLTDEQILSELDGEISASQRKRIQSHLQACWKCRARRQELGAAITDFIHVYKDEFEDRLPSEAGPRALLKAQMEQLAARSHSLGGWLTLTLAIVVGAGLWLYLSSPPRHRVSPALIVSAPQPAITPGVALLMERKTVCAENRSNNKAVPTALRRKVMQEYGLADADPGLYEIDYLVTPALGGSDDIHNLWPHSYASTIWNARVKDALEDLLRNKVCEGSLDLDTAQHEIAGNWINAYQKYFATETPLPEHQK